MRLIDADELKKECRSVPDPRGKYAELRIIEDYEIDDVPTIFEISDNATNGDVIKAMFPSGKIWKSDSYMCLLIYGQGDAQMFDVDWWNAPYQKGGKE